MARPRLVTALSLATLILLAACDGSAPLPATPIATAPAPAPSATFTTAPSEAAPPTSDAQVEVTAGPQTDAGQLPAFDALPDVSPVDAAGTPITALESPGAADVQGGITRSAGSGPTQAELAEEITAYFDSFYMARSLEVGTSDFSLDWIRIITQEPYRSYTIGLLRKDQEEVDAGKVLTVAYKDITTKLDKWQPGSGETGTALVTVKRAKVTTRKGAAAQSEVASLQFRLQRRGANDWLAFDAYNTGTGRWVSESVPPPSQNVVKEIDNYFREFYAARTLQPGGKFDIKKTEYITAFTYRDYTVPLLERQQAEANGGKLTKVTYSNIKTEVVSWYPEATAHGGIATVRVTRTANVARPSGAEPAQTETFQFRVHRHQGEASVAPWVAVDFFSPGNKEWVSRTAGQDEPIPSDVAT